jgi:hypothetical protein
MPTASFQAAAPSGLGIFTSENPGGNVVAPAGTIEPIKSAKAALNRKNARQERKGVDFKRDFLFGKSVTQVTQAFENKRISKYAAGTIPAQKKTSPDNTVGTKAPAVRHRKAQHL